MATASRDAKLTLSIEALGQDNVTELKNSLQDLAKTGGASAAELEQLADEIGRLGNQNDALQAVKALTDDTEALRAKQEQVGATVQEVTTRLDALREATLQAKAAQDTARQAMVAGDEANVAAGNSLRALKAEYAGADRNTEEYRNTLQGLVAQQNKARLAQVGLREENRRTSEELTRAEAAQRKVETTLARSSKQYTAAGIALDKQNAALRAASAEAEKLGVDITSLNNAETTLLSTFAKGVTAANERRAALADMAQATQLYNRESEGLADLTARGAVALAAEEAALKDAERAVEAYTAAKAKALADAADWQREADHIVATAEATRQTTRATQQYVETLRELKAQDAFAKQAAEAQRMVQAAGYVRMWEDALAAADAEQRQLAESTKQVNDAFKQINVRPIEQVQQEIASTNTAMATLAASGRLTGGALAVAMAQAQTKVEGLEREMRHLTGTMTLADRAAGILKNSMGQIAAGNLVADGIGYLINKVKEMGAAFVSTIANQEKLRRGLNAVYKDAQITGQQMEFLRATAVSSGVALAGLGEPFLKFAAATRAANIPLQVTNDLFAATTRAAGTLGLSGEQVSGMLEALSQMASKGTVSMEELRQQLGDRLPGALGLVARGLDITEAQLIKLVESGQLAARDLFPALTKSLKTMHGEVTGLTATWENFKNVLTGVAQDAGDAGWTAILTGSLKVLGGTVGVLALGLSSVWEAMRLVGVAAVALAATLKGDTGAWTFFNEQVAISVDRLGKQNDRLSVMLDPTSEAAKRVAALGVAEEKAAGSIGKATTAIAAQPKAVATVAESTRYLTEVTRLLGLAHLDVSAKIVRLNVLSAERVTRLTKESVAADKIAKATTVEGNALVTLTQLRGSEIESLKAQETAAEKNLAAAEKAAQAQRSVTEVLELQRQTLVDLAKQEASGLEGRKAEIEALDVKITASRAETAQSEAARSALTQEVAARQLAVQTLQDNSAAVEQFRAAAVQAEAAVKAYQAAMASGSGTTEELTKLQQQAAMAVGLYRDALADAAAKVQGLNQVEQAKINLQTTGLSVQQQAALQLAEAARATNNLAQAVYYEVEAKRIQIQITRLQAEAKKKEAAATVAAVEAERESLSVLTEAKKLELEARLLNAKAKATEAGASEAVIRGLEREITALQTRTHATNASTTANHQKSSSLDELLMKYRLTSEYTEAMIALQEREIAVTERAAEAYRKKWNIDKDGFTLDKNGQRMQQSVPTERYVYDTAKSQGLSEAQAIKLVDEFMRNGKPTGWGGASGLLGGSKDWFTVVNEAINKQVIDNARRGSSTTAGATEPTGTATTSGGGGVPVTINIHGVGSRTINVNSQSDANGLISVMRTLEQQGGTAA